APSTATSGVVIPNKSTIAEEEIKVPYGTDGDDSQDYDGSDASPVRPTPNRSGSQGYGSLGTSLLNGPLSPTTDDGREFYDRMSLGAASVISNGGGAMKGREEREAAEQMRSEYEFKIATMQNRIATLENQVASGGDPKESQDLKDRLEQQASRMKTLERELDDARGECDNAKRQRESIMRRHDGKDSTIRDLQFRINEFESKGSGAIDPGATDDLRAEVQNLVDELRELSHRNDELMAEKAADLRTIHDLTDQLKDTKRKYERAKTELRNFKSTSGTFNVQTPRMEDSMPYSDHGGILDVHVTSFQAAIDNLLSVARSNEHPNVITPMRHVVYAASGIADDLRAFEQRSRMERRGDDETVKLGRERIEATLSNLVAA
ncbi:component of the polarisome, partial [Tulasnella sp. 427]